MLLYKKYLTCKDDKDTLSYPCKIITDGKDTNDYNGDKLVDFQFIQANLRSLTGRILTIIDASITDSNQNKCVKDLVRGEFMHEFEALGDLMFDKQRIERTMNGFYTNGIDPEIITAKEALGA